VCRVQDTACRRIVVTHGTDTLIQTALFLAEKLGPECDKKVVLTGSFLPERFRESDADINIGVCLGAVSCLPPGVYTAMQGLVVPADQVARDSTGAFHRIP